MFKFSVTAALNDDTDEYEISSRDFDNLHSVAFAEDDIELEARDAITAMIGELID